MSKGLVLRSEAWSTSPFGVIGQAPWAAGGWSASVWRQAATVSGSMAARLANMRSGSAKVWQHIPERHKKLIRDKKVRVFFADTVKIARDVASEADLQMRMQGIVTLGAFLKLTPYAKESGMSDEVVMAGVVVPLCLAFGVVAAIAWGDPLSAFLHACLAGALAWPMALTALWLVIADVPFSLPYARGSTIGPLAVPMAILASGLMLWAGLHYLFAPSPYFWIGSGLVCLAACRALGRQADARLNYLWR